MNASPNRRSFLKSATLAAIPVLGAKGLNANEGAVAKNPEFADGLLPIRARYSSNAWQYLPAKTVAQNFPVKEDEKPFSPSEYGGNSAVKLKSTGFFRLEKTEGRYWLVDPLGHPFLSIGLNVIGPWPNANYTRAMRDMRLLKWEDHVRELLKTSSFNTLGWGTIYKRGTVQPEFDKIPYTFCDFGKKKEGKLKNGKDRYLGSMLGLIESFDLSKGVKNEQSLIFHPEFEAYCLEQCKALDQVKDDPWLIGYFTDNSIKILPLDYCFEYKEEDPLYGGAAKEARRWWKDRGGQGKFTRMDEDAWRAHVFDWYYRITSAAIRKYDSNHLLLGSRVITAQIGALDYYEVAGKYLDVVSINALGISSLDAKKLQIWSQRAGGKPIIVSGFSAKALDGGLEKQIENGPYVATQKDRGVFYQNFVIELLKSGVCVGWHWYRYADVTWNAKIKKLSSNVGLVNEKLQPYKAMLVMMQELNSRVYEIAQRN